MTKEQLIQSVNNNSYKSHPLGSKDSVSIDFVEDLIDEILAEIEQKDKEIAELKEDNLRLRNAQEVGGNMYGHKLNEISALHEQVESLTERLEAADEVIGKLKYVRETKDKYEHYILPKSRFEALEKYNSLKSKTK